jgi:hypothetical protein
MWIAFQDDAAFFFDIMILLASGGRKSPLWFIQGLRQALARAIQLCPQLNFRACSQIFRKTADLSFLYLSKSTITCPFLDLDLFRMRPSRFDPSMAALPGVLKQPCVPLV